MTIKFKILGKTNLVRTIKAESFLIIKVAILIHYGRDLAYELFQKEDSKAITLYHPSERDLKNLVNGSWDNYCKDNNTEIKEAILSIIEIE